MTPFSLVTACMNRDAHLRRVLPVWLKLPGLAEIVIVDWTNATPLFELATLDERVRVIRAEGEKRWILSYAYNLGISQATQAFIFKCDADCLPSADAMIHPPTAAEFHAGNWRSGRTVGKPSVNGQCFFLKSQFDAVNGYSEYIRTYGRDDEDYYDRLQREGAARREISPAVLNFLEHTQEDRVRNQFSTLAAADIEGRIYRHTLYNEMRNYRIAQHLPWGRDRARAPFPVIESLDPRRILVRRTESAELPISAEVEAEASLFSLRYVASQLSRLPLPAAEKLDRNACLRLLIPRFANAA